MSGNMNDDEFNSNLDLPRRQQELFVAALNSDSPKSHGNRLAQLSNPHANPDEEDSESDIEDSDESAIEDDDESQWEDSEDENGPSGDNDKVSFQRVDSKPNLTSRRSLLTTLMHEGDRAQALQNAASRSTPALRRSRAASPKRPSVTASSSTHAEIPRSKPIIMTTSKTHTPPALSPRSTRRNMLTTELTESLRKHLLWERQQKNSTNAVLKRRHSSTDATMRNSIAEKSQQSTDAVKADKSFEFATYKYPGEFDNPELMLTLRSRVMLDKTPHNNQAILNQRAKAPQQAQRTNGIEKHDTDEIQEDSITISKEVSQKSHIVGQVYTSDDASRIDHKTSLPPSFPANTSFAGTRAVHVDMKRKILDWMQEYLKEEANGEDADVERGPVEFSHAISYLSKIKNLSSTQPGIFKQFLEILQAYQRGSMPIKDVHAQMTQLLDSAPDLLEEFEQFIPETAAQQPHGHFDFSSTKTANLLGPRAYGGVGYTETREPVFE
ncbi:Transcriptional regulatory protein SIN3 [Lasiodiplodia hormozganensis]|uniref:Transcriptional regulatory protein SIN3 n=1 Tax=Lasiodiplodia hormozganensis TaxID=869390 RepID=A0AA39Y745_9PEZI|nr:Transcriptional regulatory protein SIN3 [Lasiodiplodia hormozganensis]